jgi:hypothetical protein
MARDRQAVRESPRGRGPHRGSGSPEVLRRVHRRASLRAEFPGTASLHFTPSGTSLAQTVDGNLRSSSMKDKRILLDVADECFAVDQRHTHCQKVQRVSRCLRSRSGAWGQ